MPNDNSRNRRRHPNHDQQNHPADNQSSNLIDEHKNSEHQYPQNSLIYSAPTVDSLGDESTLIRPFTTPRRRHIDHNFHNLSAIPPSMVLGPISLERSQSSTKRNKQAVAQSGSHRQPLSTRNKHTGSGKIPGTKVNSKSSIRHGLKSNSEKRQPRDFQHKEDSLAVAVRAMNVSERSAFGLCLPVPIEQWQLAARQAQDVRETSAKKRLSPSLQHLHILHRLQNHVHIRQLAFSPAVGLDSDIFVPWDTDSIVTENNNDTPVAGLSKRRPTRKRDGRYRSIDPVQATKAALPRSPPLLSNKKHRLPLRSDVGFPNASPEEIQRKQAEIQRETEWEEASPRLIVLVTSDDLGTAVQEEMEGPIMSHDENFQPLEGLPWAGPELRIAKERNKRHFGRTSFGRNSANGLQPNIYSMLAPPIDATYSRTLGWRPRLLHDRPPGMSYVLACPLNLEFKVGNIEPLVCSLALYNLPNKANLRGSGYGKTSEDFWFPAGDWKDRVTIGSDPTGSGIIDKEVARLWHERKHKAIYAYDPLAISNAVDSLYLVLQVYKVIQEDAGAAYLGYQPNKEQTKKGLRMRFRKNASKRTDATATNDDPGHLANQRMNMTFEDFGAQLLTPLCFGIAPFFSQRMISKRDAPVPESQIWPKGEIQSLDLYCSPNMSESQEEFVERLSRIIAQSSEDQKYNHHNNVSVPMGPNNASAVDEKSTVSASTSASTPQQSNSTSSSSLLQSPVTGDSSTATHKKKGVRRFISPRKQSKSQNVTSPQGLIRVSSKQQLHHQQQQSQSEFKPAASDDHSIVLGSASLFTSTLESDFLQAMLSTPPELTKRKDGDTRVSVPNVLVDASAESALVIDPSQQPLQSSVMRQDEARKRSSILRVPFTPELISSANVSEYREVIYLPPRVGKNSGVDTPTSHWSMINLLYLYPRLLRFPDATTASNQTFHGRGRSKYSVRIQLIQSNVVADKNTGKLVSSNKSLASFYNPVPWTGSQMLGSVYTKVACELTGCHEADDHASSSMPIRDEFKLRLPSVLDGSHYLHFTIFSVRFPDDSLDDSSCTDHENEESGRITLHQLAETTIPLSNSSSRDTVAGLKVTTIIPNGCHRLKVGDFQLQVETRLMSSTHISDPATATALRDFPFDLEGINGETREQLTELTIVAKRSFMSKSSSASDDASEKVAYSSLFASAPAGALMGHFPTLVLMHLYNFVNHGKSNNGNEVAWKFLFENMQSLLTIFARIKQELFSVKGSKNDQRLAAFIKNYMDGFDEALLHAAETTRNREDAADSISDIIEVDHSRSSNSAKNIRDDFHDDEQEEEFDGGAIRRRKKSKDALRSGLDIRISRTVSAMESEGIPFSRVAYGASKIDRMRLEAELDVDHGRYTHLIDDDETVVTTVTAIQSLAEDKLAEARESLLNDPKWGFTKESSTESASTVGAAQHSSKNENEKKDSYSYAYPKSLGEMGIGKRVRSAAEVMLAPCVVPSLSAVLSSGFKSPKKEDTAKEAQSAMDGPSGADQKPHKEKHSDQISRVVSFPGSDVDEDERDGHVDSEYQGYQTEDGVFRAPAAVAILEFSIMYRSQPGQRSIPHCRGDYLYETIMLLWLQSWRSQADNDSQNNKTEWNRTGIQGTIDPKAFNANADILLPLCLKSLVLRCHPLFRNGNTYDGKIILDEGHMAVLEPFIEALASGLIHDTLKASGAREKQDVLLKALSRADVVLDFLLGLVCVLHPAHLHVLISKYFKTLHDSETESEEVVDGSVTFEWTEENLHRVRCCRQLRLRGIEKLAVIPNFVALNYPQKYATQQSNRRSQQATWTRQSNGAKPSDPLSSDASIQSEGPTLLPPSGWLCDILTSEALSMCALSCQAVVAEAMAHIEKQQDIPKTQSTITSSLKQRPTASLTRSDLLMFQSVAIHSITCVHELLLRRHAMDQRFQTEKSRERIAAMFAKPIFEKSLASVRWLARMEATHKVRSLWFLCFVYILQEAPEVVIRESIRTYGEPQDLRIHRFIRLLRLSSSTFQSFIDQPRHCTFPSEIDKAISPWLLQESFNTICATTIIVVEECGSPSPTIPREQKKMVQGVLDLLLHILTTPQSCVTHLRAVGGAIQALEKFGIAMFLEIVGGTLQHWLRVMLSLMNSTALSVRSIAVDFVVSLLGNAFDLLGNIDEIALIFITVLPEIVARELGFYSVSGHIHNRDDVETSIWPLRRSFADVEDTNPLDDDRVDPQLSPVLSVFCRACQAVIDGVLVEMTLHGKEFPVIGASMNVQPVGVHAFDADEESLYEAASFFVPETAPMQRIRWLLTLKSLHEAKGQWVEAAETLVLCARTVSDSIPHLRNVWRPSHFVLWSDSRRSLWLSTVGEEMGHPEKGNEQVMDFADRFLEPKGLIDVEGSKPSAGGKLPQPTVPGMCKMLTKIAKEAVSLYLREGGMDELAYMRLESLLKGLMEVLDFHGTSSMDGSHSRLGSLMERKRHVEDEAAIRRVLASLSGDMTKIAERLLLIVQEKPTSPSSGDNDKHGGSKLLRRPFFVRLLLSGRKPQRFKESTTLPTYLEWDAPCVCRVPKSMLDKINSKQVKNSDQFELEVCQAFGSLIRDALMSGDGSCSVRVLTGKELSNTSARNDEVTTFVNIAVVRMDNTSWENDSKDDAAFSRQSRHFFCWKGNNNDSNNGVVGLNEPLSVTEFTVAHPFPCALSRQRALLTSEFIPEK